MAASPSNTDIHVLLQRLHDRVGGIETKLIEHCIEEHEAFNAALVEIKAINDWVRGGKVAARIILGLAAFVAGCAAAYAWVKSNFHITIK